MRFQFHSVCFTVVVASVAAIGGCALTHTESAKQQYETVAADPNRDTKTAKQLHEKALKIIGNSQNPTLQKCGCLASAVCDLHQAESFLHEALIADVRYGPAHNTLGLLYFYQRRLYLAAWEFEFAADLMRGRPEPLNNLGLVYEEAMQLGRAAEYYQLALEIAPGHPEALGNLARVQLRQGNSDESARAMLKDLLIYDSRPEWIGWAEDQLGVHTLPADPLPSLTPESLPIPAPQGFESRLSDDDDDSAQELELFPEFGR